MTNVISLLGSTGSIGRQTLDVARQMGVRVCALTANRDVARMEEQARAFHPALAVLCDEERLRICGRGCAIRT
jgi:1-deoxy-D-xylulose-5-phosphate reductoisomerase